MEMILVSDSHGNIDVLKEIVRRHPHANYYLHLGDSERYPNEIEPFVSVQGNCDPYDTYPKSRFFKTRYGTFYLEHGNGVGRSLDYMASKHADFYVYGHTHVQDIRTYQGMYILNPGSTTFPRDGSIETYLVLSWDEKGELTIHPMKI